MGSGKRREPGSIDGPTNPMVTPLLTDLYQFTMAYACWKGGKHNERAVFDLYFRRNPFGGEYTVIAGLEECIKLIANFKFMEDEIAFVQSSLPPTCENFDEITKKSLHSSDGSNACEDFVSLVHTWLRKLKCSDLLDSSFGETNQSELAAFISYALAFPRNFLALVDTYDVMRSGIPNFCAVALALDELGYKAIGIRLDSGDLAYQSCEARKFFWVVEKEFGVSDFGKMSITARNDLNEETLDALNKQGHEVDAFGIGTHLVTGYAQPALGVVFKLVKINNQSRIKLSEDVSKL